MGGVRYAKCWTKQEIDTEGATTAGASVQIGCSIVYHYVTICGYPFPLCADLGSGDMLGRKPTIRANGMADYAKMTSKPGDIKPAAEADGWGWEDGVGFPELTRQGRAASNLWAARAWEVRNPGKTFVESLKGALTDTYSWKSDAELVACVQADLPGHDITSPAVRQAILDLMQIGEARVDVSLSQARAAFKRVIRFRKTGGIIDLDDVASFERLFCLDHP